MEVRRLYFLELEDNIPYPDPGPYIHVYKYPEGGEQHVVYGLEDFDEVPVKPDILFELTQPGTEEYALWERYNLYQAILLHERNCSEIREQYLRDVAEYILRECISKEDRATLLIEQISDVYRQALCPEVKEGDLMAVLADTFQGYVEGEIIVRLIKGITDFGGVLSGYQALGNQPDVAIGIE